jgi:hypothetical protein
MFEARFAFIITVDWNLKLHIALNKTNQNAKKYFLYY